MKWFIGFIVKTVLGFVALKWADKWYVQAFGVLMAVLAIGDIIWVWNLSTGDNVTNMDVAAGTYNFLTSSVQGIISLF